MYQCLERILSRVAEHFPHLATRVLLSVQQVLQKYGYVLQKSVSLRVRPNHIKATLRMLTAMVTLGPEGARYVASVINFEKHDFHVILSWHNRKVHTCSFIYLQLPSAVIGATPRK